MSRLELTEDDFTDEMIDKQFDSPSEESALRLALALKHFLKAEPPKARALAIRIIKNSSEDTAVAAAYRTLTHFRDEETEQLFIDYILENDEHSKFFRIVDSYWNNY